MGLAIHSKNRDEYQGTFFHSAGQGWPQVLRWAAEQTHAADVQLIFSHH